jgi:uncharacterized protein (DUF4415 family)
MKQAENIVSEELQAVASPPLSDDLLARMRPVNEAHPEIPARVRGPQKNVLKDRITIRLDHEVVEFFKSHGRGWQTRINDALLEYVHLRHGGDCFSLFAYSKHWPYTNGETY